MQERWDRVGGVGYRGIRKLSVSANEGRLPTSESSTGLEEFQECCKLEGSETGSSSVPNGACVTEIRNKATSQAGGNRSDHLRFFYFTILATAHMHSATEAPGKLQKISIHMNRGCLLHWKQ